MSGPGPQLLIEDKISGYLIEPRSQDYIVQKMADCLDQLAEFDVIGRPAEGGRLALDTGSQRLDQFIHKPGGEVRPGTRDLGRGAATPIASWKPVPGFPAAGAIAAAEVPVFIFLPLTVDLPAQAMNGKNRLTVPQLG